MQGWRFVFHIFLHAFVLFLRVAWGVVRCWTTFDDHSPRWTRTLLERCLSNCAACFCTEFWDVEWVWIAVTKYAFSFLSWRSKPNSNMRIKNLAQRRKYYTGPPQRKNRCSAQSANQTLSRNTISAPRTLQIFSPLPSLEYWFCCTSQIPCYFHLVQPFTWSRSIGRHRRVVPAMTIYWTLIVQYA